MALSTAAIILLLLCPVRSWRTVSWLFALDTCHTDFVGAKELATPVGKCKGLVIWLFALDTYSRKREEFLFWKSSDKPLDCLGQSSSIFQSKFPFACLNRRWINFIIHKLYRESWLGRADFS